MSASTGPLAGIRILDLSTVLFGPYATQLLGDLGADVIKVETSEGDIMRHAGASPSPGMGSIFMNANRNKRSIVLDYKSADGWEAVRRLIASTDVFFTNVRMGSLQESGLGYEEVRAIREDVIYVHCAGFGSDGPYAGKAAYDDLIQAVSGIADLATIREGGAPKYVPALVADKSSALFAALSTLSALYARQATGKGQFVEVPMMECFTSFHLVENLFGLTFQPPTGGPAYPRSVSAQRRPYPTSDGFIAVMPYSDKEWTRFFDLGGRPEVMEDDRFSTYKARTRNTDALYGLVGEVTATRTTGEWLRLLNAAKVPVMSCNRIEDVLKDPHLTQTGFIHTREHPAGWSYVATRHPVRYSETPADIRREPPSLGEHTREILAEIGFDAETVARMAPQPGEAGSASAAPRAPTTAKPSRNGATAPAVAEEATAAIRASEASPSLAAIGNTEAAASSSSQN